MDDRRQAGVTLPELLLVLALAGLLAALSIPSFGSLLADHRLRAAAETIAMDLRRARIDAVRQGRPLFVHFSTGGPWCYRFAARAGCGCDSPDADCVDTLPAGGGERFPGIRLSLSRFAFGASSTRFDPLRGLARPGRLRLTSSHHTSLELRISPLGRVRICRPAGRNRPRGYPAC